MKTIEGYNGFYIISKAGEVYSTDRVIKSKMYYGKKLSQRKNNGGYFKVSLNINGKSKKFFVHRLLAISFLKNPNGFPCVNHKDGNKGNNNLKNLEWCSYKYNVRHSIITGLRDPRGCAKLKESQVLEIREMYFKLGLRQVDIASRFKVSQANISDIVLNKTWVLD